MAGSNRFALKLLEESGVILKEGSGFTLKRGYNKIVEGQKCLVVEDILTTGGSVKKVVDVVRECGGEVVAVSAIVNRGKVTAEMIRVPQLFSLVDLDLETWSEEECPLCRDNETVNIEVGHGAAFVAAQT